jgi:hypothetical protein
MEIEADQGAASTSMKKLLRNSTSICHGRVRNSIIPIFAGITILLLSHMASARPMIDWTPAELFERSEVVVVGKPTSVRATGKTGKIQLGKNPETPVIFYSAKVQVIATIKGEKVAKEIAIMFSDSENEDHSA